MKIKKGDTVLIMKGKDKNKKSKVLRGFPAENRVLVEGVNLKRIHKRPRREGEKGQIVEVASPLDVSKVRLVCPKCGRPTRVGYKVKPKAQNEGIKSRVCKKCGGEF